MKNLKFPTLNHKSYIGMIYDFCQRYNLALILKGSLSNGKATKYSDVDIIISGNLNNKNIDDVITIYDTPVMTNFTENPPGIMILVYPDKLSVDLDI